MANFKTHVTTSTVLGGCYAALGASKGLDIEAALVAGGLCGIGGMLPDIDSDSGVPLRETMGFAAAITPLLLLDRFQQLGLNYEQMVLAGGASYLLVRFGLARLLMRYTVHRGMFHSIPAILIFSGLAFLICGSADLQLRYFKAGGVFLGVLSHLLLDELFAVEWKGGRWRFKNSFGTAFKLWGQSPWGNISTYGKLALVILMILSEPAIMERYGQLTPIVVDRGAIKDRLNFARTGDQSAAPGGGDPATAAAIAPTGVTPVDALLPGFDPVQAPFAEGAPIWNQPGGPNPEGGAPDRTIYDTARRIWQRIRQ